MWITLTTRGPALFWVGQGGITRMTSLSQWDEARKTGFNTELASESTRGVVYVKETVEQIQTMLLDNKKD